MQELLNQTNSNEGFYQYLFGKIKEKIAINESTHSKLDIKSSNIHLF